jgi:hypothetical protein
VTDDDRGGDGWTVRRFVPAGSVSHSGPFAVFGMRRRVRRISVEQMTARVLRERPAEWTATVSGHGRRRTVRDLVRVLDKAGYDLVSRTAGRAGVPEQARQDLERRIGHRVPARSTPYLRCRFVRRDS